VANGWSVNCVHRYLVVGVTRHANRLQLVQLACGANVEEVDRLAVRREHSEHRATEVDAGVVRKRNGVVFKPLLTHDFARAGALCRLCYSVV
jgi:hypothetical protein